MHLYENPVYIKSNINMTGLWAEAVDKYENDDVQMFSMFHAASAIACANVTTHPMCMCISISTTRSVANECLLNLPVPTQYSDWNRSAVSYALFIWFTAALAASVGTIPWDQTYASGDDGIQFRSKFITFVYAALVILVILIPVITVAVSFKDASTHWSGLFMILMWGWVAIALVGSYNYRTLFDFFFYIRYTGKRDKIPTDLRESKTLSIQHCLYYLNLLASAPAIAIVLHLTVGWAEYYTIINTTLLISLMFAVDAFSAEMVNYWTYHKTTGKMETADEDTKPHHSDTTLGMIRLTTFAVNSTLAFLFVTIAYPVSLTDEYSHRAVFVILVLSFVSMLLLPDLVREFTHSVSFHSTKYRMYGDMIVRMVVLAFVWRASASGRI
jgi:hypothetical protein